MPTVNAIRLLNNVSGGVTDATALQAALSSASTLGAWQGVNTSPRHVNQILASDNGWAAVRDSDLALSSLADAPVGSAYLLANTERLSDLRQNRARIIYALNSSTAFNVGFNNQSQYWVNRVSGTTSSISSVIYGNNLYVAVGVSGVVITSPDAITWTLQTTPTGANLNDVAYGAGLFVAVGASGVLITSPDGITWTAQTSAFATSIIYGVIYANGLFVAVGAGGKISTSPDGITWTAQSSTTPTQLNHVAYGAGLFVAVGLAGVMVKSSDGITWSNVIGAATENIVDVIYANGIFITVGNAGQVTTSSSGLSNSWSIRASNTVGNLNKIAYGNGLYIAICTSANRFITSTDGIVWQQRTNVVGIEAGQGVTYNNGLFVAVGTNGNISTNV